LEPGTYLLEWFSVNSRETKSDGEITVESAGEPQFLSPFEQSGPSLIYLKRKTS
jgi:hypothetical protein